MKNLTDEDIRWIIGRVTTYVDVAGGSIGTPGPSHSALLYRLLSGKEPLPVPPPKSYSRPDYDIGEGRPVVVNFFEHIEGEVTVNQCRYKLIEKESDTVYLLEYEPSGQRFRLTKQDVYNVRRRDAKGIPRVICKGNGILILADEELKEENHE